MEREEGRGEGNERQTRESRKCRAPRAGACACRGACTHAAEREAEGGYESESDCYSIHVPLELDPLFIP